MAMGLVTDASQLELDKHRCTSWLMAWLALRVARLSPPAEQFEHAYNFRFEEPGGAAIVTHPRNVSAHRGQPAQL
jgi:hypothetical protein